MKMKTYILTTDRYYPWNGKNINQRDRIWNNLDELIDTPYLVYCEKSITVQDFVHKNVKYLNKVFSLKLLTYFISIFFKSHIYYLIYRNSKFLLGSGIFYLKEATNWYWAYSRLRNYIESNQVDIIIYHGEFNGWGLSVSWACKDTGVGAIAWQHGIMPIGYEQYKLKDKRNEHLPLPNYLFLWSSFSKRIAEDLIGNQLPSVVVGQSRITIPYKKFEKRNEFKYLLCSTKEDELSCIHYLKKNESLLKTDQRFIFKPHPLNYVKIDSSFKQSFNCVTNDINSVLNEVSLVILSHGTIAVDALRMQIPVIVVEEFCEEKHRPYLSEMPGLFIRRTFIEALELVDEIEKNGIKLDRSQFHNTARYFANDLDNVTIQKIINIIR